MTADIADRVRRWSERRQPRLHLRRRRWVSNPLESCFAGSRRTVWLQRQSSVLARNRTWTSTFAGLHAHPAHPEDVNLAAARRGVEPRLAVSRTAVRSGTLAGCVNQCPDLDLNQGLNLRRVPCSPLHHRDISTSARSRTPWSSFGG